MCTHNSLPPSLLDPYAPLVSLVSVTKLCNNFKIFWCMSSMYEHGGAFFVSTLILLFCKIFPIRLKSNGF